MAADHLPRITLWHDACPQVHVLRHAPILSAYREEGLLDSFPLHDREALDALRAKLKASGMFSLPIEDIRNYFGNRNQTSSRRY